MRWAEVFVAYFHQKAEADKVCKECVSLFLHDQVGGVGHWDWRYGDKTPNKEYGIELGVFWIGEHCAGTAVDVLTKKSLNTCWDVASHVMFLDTKMMLVNGKVSEARMTSIKTVGDPPKYTSKACKYMRWWEHIRECALSVTHLLSLPWQAEMIIGKVVAQRTGECYAECMAGWCCLCGGQKLQESGEHVMLFQMKNDLTEEQEKYMLDHLFSLQYWFSRNSCRFIRWAGCHFWDSTQGLQKFTASVLLCLDKLRLSGDMIKSQSVFLPFNICLGDVSWDAILYSVQVEWSEGCQKVLRTFRTFSIERDARAMHGTSTPSWSWGRAYLSLLQGTESALFSVFYELKMFVGPAVMFVKRERSFSGKSLVHSEVNSLCKSISQRSEVIRVALTGFYLASNSLSTVVRVTRACTGQASSHIGRFFSPPGHKICEHVRSSKNSSNWES